MTDDFSDDAALDRAAADEEAIDDVLEPEDALEAVELDGLPDKLRQAVERAGWAKLMPVQARSMPYLLAGRDLMIQSRTGSGKTAAFALPILDRVDPNLPDCQALILVPTRELAQQVARETETLAGDTGVRVTAVYGGVSYGPQLDAFKAGAHVVVGTPGRVLDHLLKDNLSLRKIQILVFDEADRMLSIGFYPDMKEVQRYLPRRWVNTFMTSATYPPHVMRLAEQFIKKPQILSLSHKLVHVAETPHTYYEVKPMEKDRALVRIIEMENPTSAIIFCNTKHNTNYIAAVLKRFGYDADLLSGDLNQNKREQILGKMRNGKLRFLVATDVAARGIDVPDLSHVILYEPPEDREIYIHRAGRTGRAGASGEVISLVDVIQKLELERIAKMYKIHLEHRDLPTDEDVATLAAERITARLEADLRDRDRVQRERMQRFAPLAKSLGSDEGFAELVAMLLDDYYQGGLDQAPPQPEKTAPAPKRPAARKQDDARERSQASPREEGRDGQSPNRKRRRRKRKPKGPAQSGPKDGGGQ